MYRDLVHALDVTSSETKHLRTCHGCQLELMWIVQGMEELASEHAVRSMLVAICRLEAVS